MQRLLSKWLLVLTIPAFLFATSEFVEAKRSCTSKRRRCLSRCNKKAVRSTKRCRKQANRKLRGCLRQSYRSGKKCVRKLKCPQAKACYKSCREKANPVTCFAKQGCAKMQRACYGTCQAPLGAMLKACMAETKMKMQFCKERRKASLESCSTNCPKCN